MARPAANRRLLVQERELAAGRVDGEGADAAAFLTAHRLHFTDRVEELLARMDGEERRVGRFARQPLRRELSGRRVQLEEIDALALRPGIGADVDVELL